MGVGGLSPALTTGSGHRGVLGGTFDPPHRLHLAVARAARDQLALDRVLVVPAGDPWRKADRHVTPAQHRLAMTRLAVAAAPDLACSDMEVRRAGPSHTLDTLTALAAQQREPAGSGPNDHLWFIVGSDALKDLPHWHEPERLITAARLAVIGRPGAALDPAGLDRLLPGLAARVDWVDVPPDPLSASTLRRRIAAGESVGNDVPPAVLAYAIQHRLYH